MRNRTQDAGAPEIVCSHQEFSGTGYPRGVRGEQIPLGARLFAIADALDAVFSDRPWRMGLGVEHAGKGMQFDPKIIEGFLSLPESTWLELRENAQRHFRLATSAVLA